jgi:hypothetical protein
MKFDGTWVLTDPATKQYGRYINIDTFEFKEEVNVCGVTQVVTAEICLRDYTEEEMNEYVSPFGYTFGGIINDYSLLEGNWLIAECIFETTVLDYID